jgi:glycosyltransferase involved in cell wall biosynthesis
MKVSVIIPTYNRAHLLPESVGSVLSQGYESVEVVVVDDGSTDNTEEVVRSLGERVIYIRQKNSGASAARNYGVLCSSGEYVQFLDSDDVLLPTCIEKLAAALDANPDCGAAYCGWHEMDRPGHVSRSSPLDRPSGDVFVEMATQYLCIVHSMIVRRESLAASGLFDTSLRMYEDMDFNVRIAAHHRFVFVPEHLVEYRLWHSDLSRRRFDLRQQQQAYMKKMARWRDAGRLGPKEWSALRRHIYGIGRGERSMVEAYDAYNAGRWLGALASGLRAAFWDPRYIFTRNWCAMAGKSVFRSLVGHRWTKDAANNNG